MSSIGRRYKSNCECGNISFRKNGLCFQCDNPLRSIEKDKKRTKKLLSIGIDIKGLIEKAKNSYENFEGKFQGADRTRELARIRDDHTCQACKRKWNGIERRFDIHHLNGICGKRSRSYDKVEEMNGLITLCHKCHLNLAEVRQKMSDETSPRPKKDKVYQKKWVKLNKPWLR